ncbi:MAG: hypothetical protein CVU05_12435 [Bacteroidetes bacterium HGW-Bacteroidetes-21]|nr:MAG: hypothetical protein CVU05_12435 [Bacteroidetes bacterium HGW-Bacteroidetes-21]
MTIMTEKIGIKAWLSQGKQVQITGMLLAFALPFGKVYVPPFIALFLISLIISPGFGRLEKPLGAKKFLFLLPVYYLLHVLGLLWTDNISYGLSDLEIKASLLLFPLFFFLAPSRYFDAAFLKKIVPAFLLGCFVSVVISGIFAFGMYLETKDICSFYYSNSSIFMHTSYLSMYIVFALYALYALDFKRSTFFYFLFGLTLFLVFYLNLLSSKAGLLSFIFVIAAILFEILIKRKFRLILVFVVFPVMVYLASSYFFPSSSSRMISAVSNLNQSEAVLNTTGESTADRILIWKVAYRLGMSQPFTGTGTGDVKDELIKTYVDNGLTYPAQLKLNAHNQFMQSFVALGIPALIILLISFIVPLWVSIRRKYWLYTVFILVFGFNILVESMLEVQAGIVFYAFWNSLLWVILANGLNQKNQRV